MYRSVGDDGLQFPAELPPYGGGKAPAPLEVPAAIRAAQERRAAAAAAAAANQSLTYAPADSASGGMSPMVIWGLIGGAVLVVGIVVFGRRKS